MTARYDLTMTIWATSIFSADLDEQVEQIIYQYYKIEET